MEKIKVHIADDHPLIVDGLRAILKFSNLNVVGYSYTGEDVVDWFQYKTADILLLDLAIPILDGFEVLKQIPKEVKTLVISGFCRYAFIQEAISLGAKGFISKSISSFSLTDAIYQVSNGRYFFSEDIREVLTENNFDFVKLKSIEDTFNGLSKREQQALSLLVEEFSYNEIAGDMNQSASTIRTYISRIKEKTNIKTRQGLAMRFAFLKK